MAQFGEYAETSIAVLAHSARAIDPSLIEAAVSAIHRAVSADKPLLICGNGGSAADAMHIAGEMVGRFLVDRRPLRAIALPADPAVMTAWSNDFGYDDVFARQVRAYGEAAGVLLAISTSGNSKNVVAAVSAAKAKAMTTIALTGEGGGALAGVVDILLAVPSRSTPLVQQVHMCVYHYICGEIEARVAAE